MKKLLIIGLFFISIGVYSQPIENQSKQTIVVTPKEDATWQAPKTNMSWWKAYIDKKENQFMKSTEKGIDFIGANKSKYIQKKFELPENATGVEKKKDSDYKATKQDQYFGEYVNNGKMVNIYCRDHSTIDGDLVDILLNDEVVISNVYLTGNFVGYYIPLKPGFNKIEVRAINEGEYQPNTAQFKVIDENGQTLVNELWNLAAGYKARFIIVKNE